MIKVVLKSYDDFKKVEDYHIKLGTVITSVDDSELVEYMCPISYCNLHRGSTTLKRLRDSGVAYKEV